MSHFVPVWSKVEALGLKNPLAQLGSYLRSQPNTGIDKQNFADPPSDLQLANLYNEFKEANPDISGGCIIGAESNPKGERCEG